MQRSASRLNGWAGARGFAQKIRAVFPRSPRLVCPDCALDLRRAKLYRELRVCDRCGHHFLLDARKRIETLTDPHSFTEFEKNLSTHATESTYARRVKAAERRTHLRESVVIGVGKIGGCEVMLVVLDFRFMGGSMGAVAGEKITRAFEIAAARNLPLLAVTASGGARIQEGMMALMQMAKTAAAADLFHRTGKPFINLLAHPTTGGVYASFASLADIILAEPRALIGFAGPRVVEILTRQKLPSDSHRAEFLFEHGMVDAIIARPKLRETIGTMLKTIEAQVPSLLAPPGGATIAIHEGARGNEGNRSAWSSVQLARRADRPTALDYIQRIFTDFVELHGDRFFGDDGAIVAGLAKLDNCGVVVIGQQRGRGAEAEKGRHGRAEPEGYRKAQRIMQLAAKWKLPVITFVDTPGAASGYEAEKRGIGMALAHSIAAMLKVRVPTIAVVIGEGGSGGALALAVADHVLMLEDAVYSVISPEGASAILYGNAAHAEELSSDLHLTARDLHERGIIDEIIPEPAGGAHTDPDAAAANVHSYLSRALWDLTPVSPDDLLAARYKKYREMGQSKK